MQKKERISGACYERNYIYNFHYHLIWVTKYRQQVFTTPELVEEMKGLLTELARKIDVTTRVCHFLRHIETKNSLFCKVSLAFFMLL